MRRGRRRESIARFDPNLRFIDASAPAGGALARLNQLLFTKPKPAGTASCRFDDDGVSGGTRGSDQMTQVVLDIAAGEAEITRERRHTPRLIGEQFEEVAAKRYRVTVTVTFSPVVIEPSSASARST